MYRWTVLTVGMSVVLLLGLACSGDPPVQEAPSESVAEESSPLAEHEPAQLLADLSDMQRAGSLRVLVHREDLKGLRRPGSPADEEMTLVTMFADSVGLSTRFVPVADRDELIPALLEGRGDVIADRLTVTPDRAEQVRFSAPVRHVDEVVVVRQGAKEPPQTIEDLISSERPQEFQPHIRATSSFVQTLERAAEEAGGRARYVPISDHLEADSILARVGRGEYPLTVQDSDAVESYLVSRSNVEVAFVLAENVPIAWAVRPSSERLVEAMNGFVFQGDLAQRQDEIYGGDLEAIRKRGVLRVAMPNNSSSYFLYRGQPVGFQYELARQLARKLDVRLEAVAPVRQRDVGRLLFSGRVDLIAATLAITAEREEDGSFSQPLFRVNEVLVQPAGATPIARLEELAGAQIHIRRTSSYWTTLEEIRTSVPGLELVAVDEGLETEQIIQQVGAGTIPLTVADSHIIERLLTYRDDVQGSLIVGQDKPLAYAVRHDQPQLLEEVNAFVEEMAGSAVFKKLYRRYFQDSRKIRTMQAVAPEPGQLSPYDDLARKYARQYGLDWRFVVAQMYQESGFDPKARSWAGARGLMQVMPGTAREMGFDPDQLYDPETSIAAGVEYLHKMLLNFDPSLPLEQRLHFALASYNAGYGHIIDARRLARTVPKDRNIWIDHVDHAIVLLEQPEYAEAARHGYCRGSEPHTYVRNIAAFYEAYVDVVPAETDGN